MLRIYLLRFFPYLLEFGKLLLLFISKASLIFITFSNITKGLVTPEKSSHPGTTSQLSEISAEWCISLCKHKSFTCQWIHPTSTQVRFHLG